MKTLQAYLQAILISNLLIYLSPAQAQVLNRPDFFRQGFDRMQQEVNNLQQSSQKENPSQLLTVQEGSLQWQKFVFQQANFSVWMPEGIQSQESLTLDTSLGIIAFQLLATHPSPWRFVSAYSDALEPSLLNKNLDEFFLSIRQAIIAKTQFELAEDKAVVFQTYGGRQWTMKNDQETMQFRVYLINQRIYVLAVRYPNSMANSSPQSSKVVDAFFDSFDIFK